MADGSLGGLGSSIGLTATAKDYSSLYRYNQQAKTQQAKAKQDKLDDIIKHVTVKAGDDLHRLEVEPMRIRTSEFIDKARQFIGQDDMSSFYTELTNFQSDLNMAKSRSAGYNGLEKTVREAASGNKYIPKNVRQAAGLMLNSATSADYIGALANNGVKQNAFFDYDEQGNIQTQSFDAYDISKATKDLISGNSVIIGQGQPVRDKYTGAVMTPKIMGLPYDDEQAKELRSKMFLNADGTVSNPTLTAKQIPSILLKNTALAAQYIDMYNLEDKTPEEIEQHFLETIVKPNVKLKESTQVTKKSGDININNQTSAGDYTFDGSALPKLNFATAIGTESQPFETDSKYSVPLAIGDLEFRFPPSGTIINKNTNQPTTSPASSKLDANYVHVLPYVVENGVKFVISNKRVQTLKSQGKKVPYAAFVEGKTSAIGVEREATNPDVYTEFTPAIRSNFAGSAAGKSKAIGAAFARGMIKLDKQIAEANK
jgi:hypothetical protein